MKGMIDHILINCIDRERALLLFVADAEAWIQNSGDTAG
jgi:hypothetical protein